MLSKYPIAVVAIVVALLCSFFSCRNATNENRDFRTDTAQVNSWINAGNKVKFKEGEGQGGDSSQLFFQKAIRLSEKVNYYQGIALGYLYWGALESRRGEYSKGRIYLDSALQTATQYHYDGIAGRIYRNIATTYYVEQDYEQGEQFTLKAIDLLEKGISGKDSVRPENSQNVHYLMLAYNDLSAVLLQMKQADKSLFYVQKSIQLARKNEDFNALAHGLGDISLIYTTLDSFKAAESAALEELATVREHKLPIGEWLPLRRLGELYTEMDSSKALPYLTQSLEIVEKTSLNDEMVGLYDIAKLYLKQRKYSLAMQFFDKTHALAVQLGNTLVIQDIHGLISEIYYAQKKYKEGYDEQLRFLTIKDSLEKNENKNKMRLLEVKFRTAQKDKSIAESNTLIAVQNEKIVKERLGIWGIAILLILTITVFLVLYRNRQRVQAEKLKSYKKEEKINMLLSVMKGEEKERSRLANELHDGIGGLLSTVKMYFSNVQGKEPALIISPEYKEAMSLLEQTLTELRKTAHNLMPDMLLKNELPDALRLLCSSIQNANSLKVSFQYYGFVGRLNGNFELFIYRIVQELLQNIVKHARATEVIVQISVHNDIFSITVEDNGIGANNIEDVEGMGLKTIRGRVEEINGSFMVSSQPQKGFSVYIEMDVKNNEKFDVFAATLQSARVQA